MTLGPHGPSAQNHLVAPRFSGSRRRSLWSALCALLPLLLLVCGVLQTHAALVEMADAHACGTLRSRSLMVYSITNERRQNMSWRPLLMKMASTRADLFTRHPRAIALTDAAWHAFFCSLQYSGRVDQSTALRMCYAVNQPTQSMDAAAARAQDRASTLFLAGIAATAAFAGVALLGTRKQRLAEQAREAAEADLRRGEARFDAFLNQAPMLAWITDAEGRTEYLNEPYLATIGRSLQDCLGVTPSERYPAEIAQVILDRIGQVARTGKLLETEEAYAQRDGSLHHFLVHRFRLHDLQGRVLVGGSAIDITELRDAAAAVHKSQGSLNRAQAIAHVGSWECDLRTGGISWSDELFRLCGLEPGALTPSLEALLEYIHPLDRERVRERTKNLIESGEGSEMEVRLLGADGVQRYVSSRAEIVKDTDGQSISARGTHTDVTERARALQEQTKFVSLIENSSDLIAMASLDGKLLSMNPAGRDLVGLESAEQLPTAMLSDFMSGESWASMRDDVLPIVMRDGRWKGECQVVNALSGTVHDMQASFFLIQNPVSGEPMCLATVQRDITDEKWLDQQLERTVFLVQNQNVELEYQQQELALANAHLEVANRALESLATTDGLTGARNHRAFQERLTEEFKRSQRTNEVCSVIMLDVDRFKLYNDQFGHPEGDRVLKKVVCALQEAARTTDFVARYGGEEFVVLLPDTGTRPALEAAERFRAAIEAQDWPLRRITASFGVATLNATTETAQRLVDMADRALYASKEAGRNRVTHMDAVEAIGGSL